MNGYQINRINEAIDNLEHLNEWENDFINNLDDKEKDYELSPDQNKVLNRISQKIGRL